MASDFQDALASIGAQDLLFNHPVQVFSNNGAGSQVVRPSWLQFCVPVQCVVYLSPAPNLVLQVDLWWRYASKSSSTMLSWTPIN